MIFETGKQALLVVENLSVRLPSSRGDVRAVSSVSFALEYGTTLGLVGESGCGKSILGRALMGILPSGAIIGENAKIKFHGKDLLRLSAKQLRQIIGKDMAMIFQDPMTTLNPVMQVGQQITEVLIHHLKVDKRSARARSLELLEKVGIPIPEQRFVQYPHQLSGGLRQRVAIAIALACEPHLLIADEPTTALDVTVQAEVLDLLARLQKGRKMAMLLITHDMGVVAGRTHSTAVMYAGKIVEKAPTDLLFENMVMPYTRALMDAMPRLDDPPHANLRAIVGQPPDLADLPSGCSFSPRCQSSTSICKQQTPEQKKCSDQNHWFSCWNPLKHDRR